MQTLQLGSRNAEVMFLQRLLNKNGATPALTEDGDFGQRTKNAVIAFQRTRPGIPPIGTVGPTTWNAFGQLSSHVHAITLYGQPTDMTCWSAAATMMLGTNRSIDAGAAQVNPDGSLDLPLANIELFAGHLGWNMVNNMSAPGVSTFLNALARGPIWLAFRGSHFAHAVVASAIYTDRAEDGSGTVMRFHDPWPPGVGTVYATTYVDRQVTLRSIAARPRAQIEFILQP